MSPPHPTRIKSFRRRIHQTSLVFPHLRPRSEASTRHRPSRQPAIRTPWKSCIVHLHRRTDAYAKYVRQVYSLASDPWKSPAKHVSTATGGTLVVRRSVLGHVNGTNGHLSLGCLSGGAVAPRQGCVQLRVAFVGIWSRVYKSIDLYVCCTTYISTCFLIWPRTSGSVSSMRILHF